MRARLTLVQQRGRGTVSRRGHGAAATRTPDHLGREMIDCHARAGPETNGASSVAVRRNKPSPSPTVAVKRWSRQRPINAHSSRKRTEMTDATNPDELRRLEG